MDTTSSDAQQRQADMAPPQVRVFINYRHDDTQGEAQLLYDRLASRFGSENLFLDVRSLQPGMEWLEEIKSHSDSCHIFLSLIGPRWISIMRAREQAAIVHPTEDYVRSEIQRALKPNSGIRVIPVLVGDKVPFTAEELPRSLRALAKLEVAYIRQRLFERDIELLVSRLEAIAREQPAIPRSPVTARVEERHPAPIPASTRGVALPPDAAHCEDVLQQMVDEGNLVPFLGSRMTPERASEVEGPPSLPDAEGACRGPGEAVRHKAGTAGSARDRPVRVRDQGSAGPLPSAEAAPHGRTVSRGRCTGSWRAFRGCSKSWVLRSGISSSSARTSTWRWSRHSTMSWSLMTSPCTWRAARTKASSSTSRPMASPRPIDHPNSYTKLPIGLDYELERTVIVKIHGAVDGNVGDYRWKENYVITEDHYIDYLSKSPIESLVPVQVLDKLKESHCLFLGYTVRDWNLRVFLKRIWEGSLGAKSWAVEPDPDVLEKNLWAQSNVDLYAADLGDYVDLLQERLIGRTSKSAEP